MAAARPSSAGLATMCWLGKYVVTADSVAGLLLGNVRWTSPALCCDKLKKSTCFKILLGLMEDASDFMKYFYFVFNF